MVATQLAGALVQHHFGGAMRAAEGVSAIAAKQRGGETAAVEIHQRHAALGVVVLQQFERKRGDAVVERERAHVQ